MGNVFAVVLTCQLRQPKTHEALSMDMPSTMPVFEADKWLDS